MNKSIIIIAVLILGSAAVSFVLYGEPDYSDTEASHHSNFVDHTTTLEARKAVPNSANSNPFERG